MPCLGCITRCIAGEGANMVITVAVRSVYGNDLVYPADDTAALLARCQRVSRVRVRWRTVLCAG